MIKAGPTYEQRNEFEHRDDVERQLANKYDKRTDVVVPFGKMLGFMGESGNVVSFGYGSGGSFTITVDGVTVVSIATSEGYADLAFTVNSFKISNGVTDETVFEIDGDGAVVIQNAKIKNLTAANIEVGSITAPLFAPGAIGVTYYGAVSGVDLTTSYTEQATSTIVSDGGVVEISFCAGIIDGGGSTWALVDDPWVEIYAQIKLNGTTIGGATNIFMGRWYEVESGNASVFNLAFHHIPGAGTHTYSIEMKRGSGNGAHTPDPRVNIPSAFRVVELIEGPIDITSTI